MAACKTELTIDDYEAMASSSGSQRGEFLKSEGNTLYQKGHYQAAYRKYTEAIKEDSINAIYYANRAACSLGLKE